MTISRFGQKVAWAPGIYSNVGALRVGDGRVSLGLPPTGSQGVRLTCGAHAPISGGEFTTGEVVLVDGREAVFLYSRGKSATVRFKTGARARVLPLLRLQAVQSGLVHGGGGI